jgi:predicted dehydrogenase
MIKAIGLLVILLVFCGLSFSQQPLRVGVAGLNHDHVYGLMENYKKGRVIILGIAEPDQSLVQKYKQRYSLPDSLFYPDVASMLEHIKPDAVLAYNAISDHLAVVEACAPKGVSVMVEKPLAVDMKQARRMEALAKQFHIQLLTNYETTWYASNQQVYEMVHEQKAIGNILRMVAHDGHQGPKEIGCSPDFLKWLTDPEKNGGGAVVDFGCYGANLMTWLMDGQAPIAVTAILRHYKPGTYPKVDDDATILLEYPGAIGQIEASWNWPFSIKDLEVFGRSGYLHAMNGNSLQERLRNTYDNVELGAVTPAGVTPGGASSGGAMGNGAMTIFSDNLSYLAAVLRGEIHPINDLSSLANNLVVVRILEAARQSAKEGKREIL